VIGGFVLEEPKLTLPTKRPTGFKREKAAGKYGFSIGPGADGKDRSPKTVNIYLAVWEQYGEFCDRFGLKLLDPPLLDYNVYLQADGPYKNMRKCAIEAVFTSKGLQAPHRAPLPLDKLTARITECVSAAVAERLSSGDISALLMANKEEFLRRVIEALKDV